MDDKKDRKETIDNKFEELTDEQLKTVTGGEWTVIIDQPSLKYFNHIENSHTDLSSLRLARGIDIIYMV